ncbi:hypothetical protein HF086_017984 [Spodoptera exigua]|uniref:Uncharacterized protein n=1 Tax=Spodoptera exigua TaxID=7107 RepID=A0A922S895_SPOEX|nr:hypothetical protein HF086_017984 [Spodoptera exigua]
MEKRLMLAAVVMSILAIAFFAAFIATLLVRSSTDINDIPQTSELRISSSMPPSVVAVGSAADKKVCTSPGCIHTASKLLLNMDEKVDPCDDFYDFACGSFVKNTRIPDDKTSVNTFSLITDQLQEQIRALLDEPIVENEPRPFVLAKTLYQACMNRTAIESRGVQPLLDMLKRLGGWPVLDGNNWDEKSFTWEKSVYNFRSAGYSVDYFLDFSISVDVKNSTKRIIDLDQASLGLSREYLNRGFSDKLVQAYYDYMVDIAVLLGAERPRAETELKESLQFEMKLANISLPLEKRRNATSLYNPMTIAELSEKFPNMSIAVGALYIRKYFNENSKANALEMVNDIRQQFRKTLNEVDWMDEKTRQAALEKADSMASHIAYPSEMLDNDKLAKFYDGGRQFDRNGNLVDWWQEMTKQKYLEKARCIIDQYSNYTVAEVGLKLNGVNTQGENIADNGGIKEAYYAYQAWTHRHGDEARLPGLEKYTPKQLFWLSAANTWCSVYRNEAIKLRITTGFHAPGRFRVVGPFSNMEEFAQDFKCPAGSPMNPINKCKVW